MTDAVQVWSQVVVRMSGSAVREEERWEDVNDQTVVGQRFF